MTRGAAPDVGTWIDSFPTTLRSYVEHLDGARHGLTPEAEGPTLGDPGKTTRYRDRIELVSADERRRVSSALGEDATWTTCTTLTARRVE